MHGQESIRPHFQDYLPKLTGRSFWVNTVTAVSLLTSQLEYISPKSEFDRMTDHSSAASLVTDGTYAMLVINSSSPQVNIGQETDPNDPEYPKQWALQATGWEKAYRLIKEHPPNQTEPVTIAYLDSGIEVSHVDMKPGILDPRSCSYISKDTSCAQASVDTSSTQHGTGTVGLVEALTNNGIGIAGEASMFNVQIINMKVIQDSGVANYSDIYAAITKIKELNDNGANIRVVVANLAGWPISDISYINQVFDDLHTQGVILIAGAGNGNGINKQVGLGWPASLDNFIAVGASDQNGNPASYSSLAPNLVLAPGEVITLCYDNEYCDQQGTSFAGPMVAAAVIIALAYNPKLTPDEFRALLQRTSARKNGYLLLRFDNIVRELAHVHYAYLPIVNGPPPPLH
jgi:hypothetical protein